MGRTDTGYLWMMRALYLCMGLAILFLQLLPLETAPRGWVMPDLLLAVTCVWVARRPHHAPIWAVGALFLLADFLLQRPPGLWAAAALLAVEALRARVGDLKELMFAAEWAIVAAILAAFYVSFMALWSLFVPYQISNALLILQMILTIAIYPVIAGIAASLFGLAKTAPGQTDALGRRV